MSPLYIGLAEGDAQTDMIATEATAALASGTDTNIVGTAAIQITDNGTLTAEGSKNYRLSAVNGSLTILEKALEGSGETPDKTGGSVPLKPGDLNSGTVQTAVIKDGDGLPRAELETNLTVPVAKALLSQEETEQVERGKDALIYLVLSEADSTSSDDSGDDDNSDSGTTQASGNIPMPSTTPMPSEDQGVGNTSDRDHQDSESNPNDSQATDITTPERGNDNREDETTPEQDENVRPQTPAAEMVEDISQEIRQQLEDAVEEILKRAPAIQPGPYIQIPEELQNTVEEDGNIRFTVAIPSELLEDGRTFYLTTVDSNGNVMILTNDSIEDGMISVTGDPHATYQIIYEDDGATLADMIGNDGTLIGTDGKSVQVSTNHCFWHWLILLVMLIGLATAIILGRKKKKMVLLSLVIATILTIVLAILGNCLFDWIFTIVAVIVMAIIAVMLSRNKEKNESISENA